MLWVVVVSKGKGRALKQEAEADVDVITNTGGILCIVHCALFIVHCADVYLPIPGGEKGCINLRVVFYFSNVQPLTSLAVVFCAQL